MEIILVVAAVGAAVVAIVAYRSKKRRQALLDKYGDSAIVELIMQKKIWQGMSEEQLLDSWGQPADKDQKVYKTKITETFKYNQTGKNRFRCRVRVENGFVVGWDQK